MYLKGLFILGLVIYISEIHGQSVCPECICPVEYSPFCARQQVTGKERGFNSKCVMDCSNQCRKNKFEYFKDGRCGTGRRKYITFDTNPERITKKPRRPSLLFL